LLDLWLIALLCFSYIQFSRYSLALYNNSPNWEKLLYFLKSFLILFYFFLSQSRHRNN
jgi:hypothetical protein